MKKRILHILNSSKYSGAENVVLSIIRNLNEYDFAYVAREGDIRARLEHDKVRFYLLGELNRKELKSIIDDFKPDLIHAHDFTASILIACVGSKVPIISHLHNNPIWIKKYGIKSISYFVSARKFCKILAVSKPVFTEYVFGKYLTKKSEIVFNPVNIEEIRKLANQKKDTKDTKYHIVSLGRISKQKNPQMFVDIVEDCVMHYPKIQTAMIGSGELEQDVKQYIVHKQMNEQIDMLGFQENPYPYLNNSKILCIPSLWEGFGMVAVEALILGKPVVAAAVGGLPSIVNDSCGRICCNKEDYVDEILKLLTDEEYYQKKSLAAKRRAEELVGQINYYEHLKQIYRGILYDS